MDFLYYDYPEHDVPIDPPNVEIDWEHVDLTMPVCVSRGVAYLLATHPRAVHNVNLKRLALDDCTDCVLGQLFGDYADSPEYLRYGGAWLVAHGFTLDVRHARAVPSDWDMLTEEWRQQLAGTGLCS